MENVENKIGKLIEKQSIAFIGSIDTEGFPNMKAMLKPRKREGLRTFYFTTNTSSMRIAQYRKDNKACLYFYSKFLCYKGVMLKGTMEVLTDAKHKEMIWQKGDTEYYKEGVPDSDYCVLKFTAISGRYYSNFSSENFPIE